MLPKLPPVPVSAQPVPALYASLPGEQLNRERLILDGVETSSKVASKSEAGQPAPLDKTPQTVWRERATVSRAYAKILLNGGSLG